jgi:hypothetical protein
MMIPTETQIFRLIFPPSGSIPLEKLEAVPHIRQHINSIIDLASTEHGISSPDESAALTARVIELRDTPGPDGKVRTWRTIAEICGTTLDAVRHRYGKATIRKSRIVEDVALTGYDIKDKLAEFQNIGGATVPDGEFTETEHQTPQQGMYRLVPASPEEFQSFEGVAAPEVSESAAPKPITEKPAPLDPETMVEVDRMLGDGVGVLDIAAELEKKGKLVPWTKIRARAAYLAKMKRKEAAPEPEKDDGPAAEEPREAEATDDRPEPRSISREELDLLMWDLHKAGKTLDEISDILYSKGLYYSPKSVRVRLLSQGAKL